MLRVVEGDVGGVGLVPQAGVAVGVEQLHFLAGLFQRRRPSAVGPAAQEAGPRLRAVPPPGRSQGRARRHAGPADGRRSPPLAGRRGPAGRRAPANADLPDRPIAPASPAGRRANGSYVRPQVSCSSVCTGGLTRYSSKRPSVGGSRKAVARAITSCASAGSARCQAASTRATRSSSGLAAFDGRRFRQVLRAAGVALVVAREVRAEQLHRLGVTAARRRRCVQRRDHCRERRGYSAERGRCPRRGRSAR